MCSRIRVPTIYCLHCVRSNGAGLRPGKTSKPEGNYQGSKNIKTKSKQQFRLFDLMPYMNIFLKKRSI